MFDSIFEAIAEWARGILAEMVQYSMTTMYTDVNEKTGEIAAQVGQTPQGWNSSIFGMVRNLSDTVIVPIAGMVITFVLCYELISMLTERNNMHEIDTWMFFKLRSWQRGRWMRMLLWAALKKWCPALSVITAASVWTLHQRNCLRQNVPSSASARSAAGRSSKENTAHTVRGSAG